MQWAPRHRGDPPADPSRFIGGGLVGDQRRTVVEGMVRAVDLLGLVRRAIVERIGQRIVVHSAAGSLSKSGSSSSEFFLSPFRCCLLH